MNYKSSTDSSVEERQENRIRERAETLAAERMDKQEQDLEFSLGDEADELAKHLLAFARPKSRRDFAMTGFPTWHEIFAEKVDATAVWANALLEFREGRAERERELVAEIEAELQAEVTE